MTFKAERAKVQYIDIVVSMLSYAQAYFSIPFQLFAHSMELLDRLKVRHFNPVRNGLRDNNIFRDYVCLLHYEQASLVYSV